MQSQLISRSSSLALLLAAFDGVPHSGSRELRLSQEERLELEELLPQAEFQALDDSGERCWYQVTLA